LIATERGSADLKPHRSSNSAYSSKESSSNYRGLLQHWGWFLLSGVLAAPEAQSGTDVNFELSDERGWSMGVSISSVIVSRRRHWKKFAQQYNPCV